MKRFILLEELKEHFQDGVLLDEIVHALSDAQFEEIYEHIKRMWGINV